jgi:hypothetical protein
MEGFAPKQGKSWRIGAFKTQEGNASDVPDSRVVGSGDYGMGSIPQRLQSVTSPGGTLQGIP